MKLRTNSRESIARDLFDGLRDLSADGDGVTRGGYSPKEDAAHRFVQDYAQQLGLEVQVDRALNTWIGHPGTLDAEGAVVVGSHLDSVRQGGNYDGSVGVVGGLITLLALDTAHMKRPVRVVAFRGEESSWFGTCYIGSRAVVGSLESEMLDAYSIEYEKTLRAALQEAGADLQYIESGNPIIDPSTIHQYLELHIEQGPALIAAGCPVGAVTGIRGNYRYPTVHWSGEAGHSGAVPRELRHDAVLGVAAWLSALEQMWEEEEQRPSDLVMTAGVLSTDITRHGITRIPEAVKLSLDIRSLDTATLDRVASKAEGMASSIAEQRGLGVSMGIRVDSAPAQIPESFIQLVCDVAQDFGHKVRRLPSGAGHDAAALAEVGIPIGMIFIRNENGSHNPYESIDPADFLAGVDVLAAVTEHFVR